MQKRRQLIDNGNNACLYCGVAERNEHMIMCQDPKALFHQSRRLTALTVWLFKTHGGSEAIKIWLAQVSHIMHGHQEQFQPTFLKTALEAIKGQIREALTQQNLLDAKLTIFAVIWASNGVQFWDHSQESTTEQGTRANYGLKRLFPFYGDLPRERGGPRMTNYTTGKTMISAIRSEQNNSTDIETTKRNM